MLKYIEIISIIHHFFEGHGDFISQTSEEVVDVLLRLSW